MTPVWRGAATPVGTKVAHSGTQREPFRSAEGVGMSRLRRGSMGQILGSVELAGGWLAGKLLAAI